MIHVAALAAAWNWGPRLPGNRNGLGSGLETTVTFLEPSLQEPSAPDESSSALPEFVVEETPTPPVEDAIEVQPIASESLIAVAPRPAVSSNPVPALPKAGHGARRANTAGGSGGAGHFEAPQYRNCPPPPYPREARTLRAEGTTLLLVTVDPRGNPARVSIRRGSGSTILDAAAVSAVKRWQFTPGKVGDRAVSAEVEVPVRFRFRS